MQKLTWRIILRSPSSRVSLIIFDKNPFGTTFYDTLSPTLTVIILAHTILLVLQHKIQSFFQKRRNITFLFLLLFGLTKNAEKVPDNLASWLPVLFTGLTDTAYVSRGRWKVPWPLGVPREKLQWLRHHLDPVPSIWRGGVRGRITFPRETKFCYWWGFHQTRYSSMKKWKATMIYRYKLTPDKILLAKNGTEMCSFFKTKKYVVFFL